MRYEMRPISKTFESKLFSKQGRPLLKLYHLQTQWPAIVGGLLSERSFPKQLDRGKLVIAVENTVWAQQLSLLQEEIKHHIYVVLGEEIKGVKCVQQSPLPSRPVIKPLREAPKSVSPNELNLSRDRSLEEILSSVHSKLQALKTRP